MQFDAFGPRPVSAARPSEAPGARPRRSGAPRILLAAGLVLTLALGSGCGAKKGDAGPTGGAGQGRAAAMQKPGGPGGAPAMPPVPVAVEPAGRGPIASYYSATATLEPNKEAEVLARVSGVILSLQAEEGDRVQKGEQLLQIQDDEYRYRMKQAEAEVDKQQTRFDRLEKMFAGNLVSAEEFDTARTDLESAKAARDLAQLELSYTRVIAPFTGRVTRRFVDPGQTVQNGTQLYALADMGKLLARVHVPSKEFRKIQADQPVSLTLDSDGEKLQGSISLVSPIIEPTTGTIKVTVEIPEYPARTRPGDFAEVRIVTERHPDAVLVPKEAVVTDRGDQVVFVAADSTAERRVVQVGFQDDEHAEILSGLAAGDRVVVQGQRSLKHGSPLKIMDKMNFTDAPAAARADS